MFIVTYVSDVFIESRPLLRQLYSASTASHSASARRMLAGPGSARGMGRVLAAVHSLSPTRRGDGGSGTGASEQQQQRARIRLESGQI